MTAPGSPEEQQPAEPSQAEAPLQAEAGPAGAGPTAVPPAVPPGTVEEQRQLLGAATTMGGLGFVLVLTWQLVALGDHMPYVLYNQLGAPKTRMLLLIAMAIAAVLPALGTLLIAWRRRSAIAGMDKLARLLGPAILMPMVPALFEWRIGHGNPLFYLVLLAFTALMLRFLFERSFEAATEITVLARAYTRVRVWFASWGGKHQRLGALTKRVLPILIVITASSAYAAYMSYYTILNHRLIQTTGFDLGIYDNLMFNAMEGTPFRSPVLFGPGERIYLSGHAEYAMLLFLPFYMVSPGPETLLIIQATVLGFAAVPLYLFARQRLSAKLAVVVSLAYLLFAPLHQPNFYDFHWLPLATFFHFWLYYALLSRKNWLFWPVLLVLFAIREDVAVGTAVLGLFIALTQDRFKLGLSVLCLSSVWFVVNKFVIMPSFGEWWFQALYQGLFADGQPGYGSVIQTLVTNPIYSVSTLLDQNKLTYFLHMTASLAFLPVRRLKFLWLALPGAAFTILTTGYWPTLSIRFQYSAHWIPYLFLATVLSLSELARASNVKRLLAWTGTLAVCCLSHSYNFGAVLQNDHVVGGFAGRVSFKMNDAQAARYEALMKLVRMIPPKASVAATEYMNPHISTRKTAFVARYPLGTPDYILLSSLELPGQAGFLRQTLLEAPYGLVETTGDEFYLFKRGHKNPETDKALRRLRLPIYRKPTKGKNSASPQGQ